MFHCIACLNSRVSTSSFGTLILCLLIGVEKTDIMPEKTADTNSTQATPAPALKKKPAEKPSTPVDSGSDSDRTLTDGGEFI